MREAKSRSSNRESNSRSRKSRSRPFNMGQWLGGEKVKAMLARCALHADHVPCDMLAVQRECTAVLQIEVEEKAAAGTDKEKLKQAADKRRNRLNDFRRRHECQQCAAEKGKRPRLDRVRPSSRSSRGRASASASGSGSGEGGDEDGDGDDYEDDDYDDLTMHDAIALARRVRRAVNGGQELCGEVFDDGGAGVVDCDDFASSLYPFGGGGAAAGSMLIDDGFSALLSMGDVNDVRSFASNDAKSAAIAALTAEEVEALVVAEALQLKDHLTAAKCADAVAIATAIASFCSQVIKSRAVFEADMAMWADALLRAPYCVHVRDVIRKVCASAPREDASEVEVQRHGEAANHLLTRCFQMCAWLDATPEWNAGKICDIAAIVFEPMVQTFAAV